MAAETTSVPRAARGHFKTSSFRLFLAAFIFGSRRSKRCNREPVWLQLPPLGQTAALRCLQIKSKELEHVLAEEKLEPSTAGFYHGSALLRSPVLAKPSALVRPSDPNAQRGRGLRAATPL